MTSYLLSEQKTETWQRRYFIWYFKNKTSRCKSVSTWNQRINTSVIINRQWNPRKLQLWYTKNTKKQRQSFERKLVQINKTGPHIMFSSWEGQKEQGLVPAVFLFLCFPDNICSHFCTSVLNEIYVKLNKSPYPSSLKSLISQILATKMILNNMRLFVFM